MPESPPSAPSEDLDFSVLLDPKKSFPEPVHSEVELRNIEIDRTSGVTPHAPGVGAN